MLAGISPSSFLCAQALADEPPPLYAQRMKNSVLSSNITRLRDHLGLKQAAFAERIGSTQPNVSKWERLGNEPETRPLAKMAALAGCSVAEFIEQPWAPASQRPVTGRPVPAPAGDDDTAEIISLDLSLSMGAGTLIEDFIEEERVRLSLGFLQAITRTPSDRLRLVRGIGDSMEPTLRTGDRVLIDINERQLARSHGVYWIDHLGTHGIKRLRPSGRGRVLVMSDNPLVPDFEVDGGDIRIEGRAIWFARDL